MEENKNKNSKKIILVIIIIGAIIGLAICFVIAYNNTNISNSQANTIVVNNSNAKSTTAISNTSKNTENKTENSNSTESTSNAKTLNITAKGEYDLTGEYESIIINTSEEVSLKLNEVQITNSNGPAINIEEAKKVTIELSGTNKITSTTTEDLDGAIYSKADLVLLGEGSLEIKSNYDGIVSKDTLVIKNGTYTISTDDDGIRGKDSVEISGGTFTINAGGDGIKASNDEDTSLGYVNISEGTFNITSKSDGIQGITKVTISGGTCNITSSEGIEATYVKIDNGTINIEASDDGINASQKSNIGTPTVEINGGNITIKMGQGDTDGIDANGNIYINGGTINITGNSPFDYDGTAQKNGGTIIVNGTQTDAITNQMMGGGMKGGNFNPMNQDGNMLEGGQMPNGEERQFNGGRRGR